MCFAGCSFTFQPRASLDPHARRPSLVPVALDAGLTAATAGLAIAAATGSCDGIGCGLKDPIAWGFGLMAVPFAISAVYGYIHYRSGADARGHELAGQALASAKAGDCVASTRAAGELADLDRTLFDVAVADPQLSACVQRACNDRVLDRTATGERVVVLGPRPCQR